MAKLRLSSALLSGLLILAIALLAPSARAEVFTIEQFKSDIQIETNGTIEIEETLFIRFSRARHGIYRDIPYRYNTTDGGTMLTPVSIEEVTNGTGRELNYDVTRKGNTMRVRIGSADRWVNREQVYVIRYRVKNALMFMEDHDELYWNVTGNAWDASIEAVDVTVRVDTDKHLGETDAACYTGRYGSKRSDCEWERINNGATFTSTELFRPREGLTIAFGWPKGIVSPPSAWEKFLMMYRPRDNWPWVTPIIALIWMTILWWRKGRDPKVREAMVVRYRPPEIDGKPMTPGEVGCLIDEKLDPRDMSAVLLGLGVKGYIKIEETKDIDDEDATDYRITRLKQFDNRLTPFEQQLADLVFPFKRDVARMSDMRGEFLVEYESLKSTLFGSLVRKRLFVSDPDSVKQRYAGMAVVAFAFIFGLGILTAEFDRFPTIVAAVLSAGIVLMFSKIMPAKTRIGARALAEAKGFQEFMRRADKDRIEKLGASAFYEYLPYALALGVTDQWAHAFEGMITAAPDWYVPMGGFHYFGPTVFARSISTATTNINNITYSAPRGSGLSGSGLFSGGGGGGGFSGGGGGGGGGGSW